MIPTCIAEEDFKYNQIDGQSVIEFYNKFMELLNDFSLTVNQEAELEVVVPIITRICERIDQRKDYYLYYHSTDEKIMHMSYEKEMALWAFWVSKYKPVRFCDIVDEELFFLDNGCTVSDAFACYIIISIVCANNTDKVKYFTQSIVKDMYYDLSNRDFSKEAIISKVNDLIN